MSSVFPIFVERGFGMLLFDLESEAEVIGLRLREVGEWELVLCRPIPRRFRGLGWGCRSGSMDAC
jgi:hypothetical protein